nr:PepSY-like domain-containing protein [Bacteroidota bacterium]
MKKTLALIFFFTCTTLLFGQNTRNVRLPVETIDIPKKVRSEFKIRYPDAMVKMWYVTNITYWYQDYGPSYYNNWYQPRTVVVYKFNEPANYEVEFMNDYENSRAIFNRYGVWFETRTEVYQLPEEILSKLDKSEFGSWKWSDYKERIEAPGMPGSVYRMQVSNRQSSHVIRLNDDGKVIQIKTE